MQETVQLTERQQAVLRRVVEEFVGTGQPVGSKTLVERSDLRVSPSTVRAELAELEQLGLLTHPHTSAGRVPTERGYRYLRRRAARPTRAAAARLSRSTCTSTNTEVESALQATTEMLSQVTRLLALVSAPPLEATHVRHVEVLLLQPQLVMVVVITSAGGVSKRLFHFEEPVDAGLAQWANDYLNEAVAGLQLGTGLLRRRFEDRGPEPRRARVPRRAPAGVHRARLGRAATVRRRRRRPARARFARTSSTPTAACSSSSSAAPTCSTCSAQPSALAASLRPRRARARASGARRDRARRRVLRARPSRARRRQPRRPRADGLREGARRRSLGRARALALRRVDLRRRLRLRPQTAAATFRRWRPPTATTTSCSESDATRARPRSSAPSGGSRASFIPTCPTRPTRRSASAKWSRRTRCCRRRETRDLYDRYGHAGLRSGGFQSGHVDFGNLADLFSAFFGDDVLFGGRAGSRRAHGADVAAIVEIDLVEAAHGVTLEVPYEVAVTCARCGGEGAEPGSAITTCATCGGAGRLQQVTRSVFGEFVRTQTCPTCSGTGRQIEQPCTECRGAGRVVEERTLAVEIPPGIHHGQQIRHTGEGHAGRRRRPRGRRLRRGAHPARRALRARGRRHLHDRRPSPSRRPRSARPSRSRRSTATRSSSFPPGRSPARSSSCAAAACPCSRVAAAATSASSSTSSCRAG